MIRIDQYRQEWKDDWDAFVDRSKNGTFLFRRDYMEYHRDRFSDCSLVIRDDKEHILAILPANRVHDRVVSHGGLTYGGFVTDWRITAGGMLAVLEASLEWLRQAGATELVLKPVPYIYHTQPADEADYALFRCGGVLNRRDVTTTVRPATRARWQERRLRSLKKARAAGIAWALSDDYARFWPILEENLFTAHNLTPVHTLDEICYLSRTFPAHIKLFCAFAGGEMVAGTVIYESTMVAHAQYTTSSLAGRTSGALDVLFFHLLTEVYVDKPWFDFGVSTEDQGRTLNEGLVAFKEGFGGRTITHDFYRLTLG